LLHRQWNEIAVGLNFYKFPARLYDPARGRWTGADPMAASEGFGSPYAYVGGNPIRYQDPIGMARQEGQAISHGGAVEHMRGRGMMGPGVQFRNGGIYAMIPQGYYTATRRPQKSLGAYAPRPPYLKTKH
jgi:RHS repeat-associated protein